MKHQMALRSKKDFELERDFISRHTEGGADIQVSEDGRVMHAIYHNPIYSFYTQNPDTNYAYSDMTDRVDKVIADGPDHPKALENVKKIMDGTL